MNIRTLEGLEDIYLESVEGTDAWYYGQWTPCAEAYEVPYFENKYPGTKLYFIEYPSGKVFEPVKQERNVFLERPVYDPQEKSFGIIRYDFNQKVIQVLNFKPEWVCVKVITELPFSKAEDLVNLRLKISPLALVKYDVHNDTVTFLWPKEIRYQLEENEHLYFHDGERLYSTRWMEDPDYHEEIILRDATTGRVLERSPGYLRIMPDGSVWKMTSKL